MRHSNTGKSDPQPAPVKRGFFAAAGERLKRAMSGSRAETVSAPAEPEIVEGVETEVTTSVQARARELLTQDRASKRPRSNVVIESDDVANLEARARKTSPPPLPWQRTAAESSEVAAAPALEAPSEASTGTQPIVERPSRPPVKRPVRDSKSEALRARLGAAKAALAEAQAKRAAEAETTQPEVVLEFLDETPSDENPSQPSAAGEEQTADTDLLPIAALAEQAADNEEQTADTDLQPIAALADQAPQPSAAKSNDRPSKPPAAEPIRTLTIARVLARQGYYDRSLSIYEALLKETPDDSDLRAEADRVRADKAGDRA
jgi:hypothetical protein